MDQLRVQEEADGVQHGHSPRLDYVDGVRAAAAMYVILHHVWLTTWPGYPRNTGPWFTGWLVYGHVAVAVFIVVSGFSLGLAPAANGFRLKGGTREFYRRRAWRILPAYWAALVFASIVLLITGAYSGLSVSLKGTVVHALLLQDVFGSSIPNGVFWSIAIEAQIYIIFPLILWFRHRLTMSATVATATALATVIYLLSVRFSELHRLQSLVPQFAALFVMGMAGAELANRWHNDQRWRPWATVAGVGGLAIMVWLAFAGSVYSIAHLFWVELCVGVVVALGLAGLADGTPRLVRRLLESRPSRWFGAISYSSYLIHATILMLIFRYVVDPFVSDRLLQFVVFLALGLPLALVASHVFSRAIEQPTQRHRSFSSLRAAAAASMRPRLPAPRHQLPVSAADETSANPDEASV